MRDHAIEFCDNRKVYPIKFKKTTAARTSWGLTADSGYFVFGSAEKSNLPAQARGNLFVARTILPALLLTLHPLISCV